MAPWVVLNPRGPHTVSTLATARRCLVLPCFPADLTPSSPQALWGIAEVTQPYPQGRWCVKGDVECVGPFFPGGVPGRLDQPGCLRGVRGIAVRTRCSRDSSDDRCQGAHGPGRRLRSPALRKSSWARAPLLEPARTRLEAPWRRIPSEAGNPLVQISAPWGRPASPTRTPSSVLLRVSVEIAKRHPLPALGGLGGHVEKRSLPRHPALSSDPGWPFNWCPFWCPWSRSGVHIGVYHQNYSRSLLVGGSPL